VTFLFVFNFKTTFIVDILKMMQIFIHYLETVY